MSDPRYDKLIELWEAGQIDEDKFKRALVLIRSLNTAEEEVQGPIGHEPEDYNTDSHLTRWRALAFPALIVGVAGCLVLAWLIEIGLIKGVYTVGTAGWMAGLLAIGGIFLACDRPNSAVFSVAFFVLLLTSPMWEGRPESVTSDYEVVAPARTLAPAFTKTITEAELGTGWPFPAYRLGVLRCERATVGSVHRPLVTIELGGLRYGLNGAAQSFGFPDSRTQMTRHSEWGTYELGASDEMIADALAKCG